MDIAQIGLSGGVGDNFLVGNDVMEIVSTKVNSSSSETESRNGGDQKNRTESTKENSAASSFLKVFQKISGQQAQAMLSGVGGFDLISQIKAPIEIEEKIVVEEEKVEAKPVEENLKEDSQEEVVEENETKDPVEVVAKEVNTEVKSEKAQEVVEQSAVVVAQATAPTQTVQEEITIENQVKDSNKALNFELNKQNLNQSSTQHQRAVNEQNATTTQQQAETVAEQAPKAQVGEVDKVKQQFAKMSEDSAKNEKATNTATDQTTTKIEANVEIKPQQLVDRNKAAQTQEGIALKNLTVQTTVVDTNVAHNTTSSAADASAKNSQTISSVSAASEKSNAKKSAGNAASDLPKTQQDKVIEKLQQMMETAAKGRNANTMVVRLDPPQLGQLTMKISYRGDQVYAKIIPESADVEALLRSKSAELTNVLVNSGFKAENINISFASAQNSSEMSLFGQMMGNNNSQAETYSQGNSAGANNAFNFTNPKQDKKTTYESTGWVA